MNPGIVAALVWAGAAFAGQPSDEKILYAIGSVETGFNRSARGDHGASFGAYQMSRDSWATANRWLAAHGQPVVPFRDWRSASAQDTIAKAFICSIKAGLADDGITNPTPEQIGLIWNMGINGARRVGYRPESAPPAKCDYAIRVGNLSRDQ